jgi:archaellum component FlaC
MTKCPLCNFDLEVDDIRLENHLSDIHSNSLEVAKALADILERVERIEHNIEKSHGPMG